ncbi:MAG: hypothetical protein R3C68_19765, partial [Myxococcota bacterium]
MAAEKLDHLVDEIARRVQARLGSSAGNLAPTQGLPARMCEVIGTDACDTCRGCHVHRPDDVRHIIRLGAARIAAGIGHGAPDADLAG